MTMRRYREGPTKTSSGVRQTADVYAPPVRLLAKLGSIVVHVDEAAGKGGHEFDWAAIRSLLADREVQDWLVGMDAAGLLPKKRQS
jgi:hypothetical protein